MGRFDGWGAFAQGQQIGSEQLLQAVGAQQRQAQIEAQRRYEDRLIAEVEREAQQRGADEKLAEFTYAGNYAAIPLDVYTKASPSMRRLVDDKKTFMRRREEVQKLVEEGRVSGEIRMNPFLRKAADEVGITLQADDLPIPEQTARAEKRLETNNVLLNRAKESGVDVAMLSPLASEVEPVKMQAMIADLQKQAQFAAGLATFQQTGDPTGLLGPGVMPQGAQLGVVQDQRAAANSLEQMRAKEARERAALEAAGVDPNLASVSDGVRSTVVGVNKEKAEAARQASVAKRDSVKKMFADSLKLFEEDEQAEKERLSMLNEPTKDEGEEARQAYNESYAGIVRSFEVRKRSKLLARESMSKLQQAALSQPPSDPQLRQRLMSELARDASLVLRRDVSHTELIDLLEGLAQQDDAVQSK